MFSIEADFDFQGINAHIEKESNAFLLDLLEDWRAAGKRHVDNIKAKTKYTDATFLGSIKGSKTDKSTFNNITYNLRSSIGYLIIYNGEIIEDYFPVVGGATEGAEVGRAWAREVSYVANEHEGIQMIIVAGMEYAVFVQSKGYDVIDHATETQLPKILMEEINR